MIPGGQNLRLTAGYRAIREMVGNEPSISLQAICDALMARGMTGMVGKDDKKPMATI
jgi:hypothetical protein